MRVLDTTIPYSGGVALCIDPADLADVSVIGTSVVPVVDRRHRQDVSRHHTATHLLHSALRSVLGSSVTQAGSLVGAQSLRFDFVCNARLTPDKVRAVEGHVNQRIASEGDVIIDEMTYADALQQGALTAFGERFTDDDIVRVVLAGGESFELCCGTHAKTLGELYPFKILSQSSVAAGVRRITAVCGRPAIDKGVEAFDELSALRQTLGDNASSSSSVGDAVAGLLSRSKAMERDNLALKTRLVLAVADRRAVNGIDYIVSCAADVDLAPPDLKQICKRLSQASVVAIVTATSLTVAVPRQLSSSINARDIVLQLASGAGGGSPSFASASLTAPVDAERLWVALATTRTLSNSGQNATGT